MAEGGQTTFCGAIGTPKCARREDAHWDWDQLIDLTLAMPNRFEVYVLESENRPAMWVGTIELCVDA